MFVNLIVYDFHYVVQVLIKILPIVSELFVHALFVYSNSADDVTSSRTHLYKIVFAFVYLQSYRYKQQILDKGINRHTQYLQTKVTQN